MIRICSLWSSENVQWNSGNWTWDECEIVKELCTTWNNTKFTWANANWHWNKCSGYEPPIPPTPVISVGNPPGVDATTLIQPWLEEPWNPYKNDSIKKQKRLIKLVCKVKGQKYDEEKEVKDFNLTIGDIRTVVKAVANIDLEIKMEE